MRILHLVHQYPPERIGSTELCPLVLRQDLMQRGHQVAVFYGMPVLGLMDRTHCLTQQNRANLAAVQTIDEISAELATLKRPPSRKEE